SGSGRRSGGRRGCGCSGGGSCRGWSGGAADGGGGGGSRAGAAGLGVGAVAEGGLGQEDVSCAGAVEDDHLAAGRVGVAVVEVEEHGAGGALAGRDTKNDGGMDAYG